MSKQVFVNYRRDDAPGYALALHLFLRLHFPRSRVFFDVNNLRPADRWKAEIDAAVRSSAVMLMVVGPRWVELLRQRAQQRAEDFVVYEVASALAQGTPIVAVMVDGGRLPPEAELPAEIRGLRDYQAIELTLPTFEWAGQRLVEAITPRLPSRAPPPPPAASWRSERADLEFVRVPAGLFRMGASQDPSSPNHDPEAEAVEGPVRSVRIPTDFWLGKHPVTREQYRAFLEATHHAAPGSPDDPLDPVTEVTWHDANAFCAWLTAGLEPGWRAALPTEAMWEYAARGTDGRRYPWGNEPPTPERARFDSHGTAPVGGRPQGVGPFGAHDQAGNVWEWCRDVYRTYPRATGRVDSPVDTVVDNASAAPRVVRGGSWRHDAWSLRASHRLKDDPGDRLNRLGFRVCVFSEPGGRS